MTFDPPFLGVFPLDREDEDGVGLDCFLERNLPRDGSGILVPEEFLDVFRIDWAEVLVSHSLWPDGSWAERVDTLSPGPEPPATGEADAEAEGA